MAKPRKVSMAILQAWRGERKVDRANQRVERCAGSKRGGTAKGRAQEYIRITIVVVDWAGRGRFRVPWLTGLVPVVVAILWGQAFSQLSPGKGRREVGDV
ncbi:hypothetical protein BR1R5_32310 [Pseudomonas sp. BR1R-5]|nr:hypothetical protein BR1R5_32310 [Pseudomonas sp. BR1R-5]